MSLGRFLGRLIWLCVLPLTLLATFLALNHVRHIQEELETEAGHVADNLVDGIDHELTTRIAALRLLSQSPLGDDPTRWSELHAQAQGLHTAFGTPVSFAGADGKLLFDTRYPFGAELPPLNAHNRNAMVAASERGRPVVGDLGGGVLPVGPMAPVAVPGLRDGRVVNVVAGPIEARQLRARLAEFSLPAGWTVELIDSTGALLARHPDTPPSAAGDADPPRRFTSASRVAAWTVSLSIPGRLFRAPLLQAGGGLALAVLGVTLAAVLGGNLAARRLAATVKSLATAPDPADARVAIIEIDAVRQMLAASNKRRDQAERARREVEQRYRERLEQSAHDLELSQARLSGIFESATQAILTADESHTIVMANPAAAQLFRCPQDALIGAPLERFIPERFRERHREAMDAFGEQATGSRHMGQRPVITGLRADGEEFPIDAGISRLEVAGQRLFTVILRDITPRLRAEQALRASEARLRRLLMLLPVAVFVEGGGRVSFVNDEAQRLLGADAEALVGRALLDFVDPGSRAEIAARLAALRDGSGTLSMADLQLRRLDGSTREAEAVGTLFTDGAEPSLIVLLRDVTALRRAQAALAESHADLRRLVAGQDQVQEEERKRIARELHDDLQQTLAAIRIDLGTIGTSLGGSPAATVLREVDALAAAAIVSLRRIVNDLRPKMLEDLGLVAALESLCTQFGQRSGVACDFEAEDVDEDADIASPQVSTCLYRIAQEALTNVARHAQAHSVQVRLRRDDDGTLRLHIADDGRGIAEGDRRKPGGFGLLGMHERVRAIGGELRIASVPGAGTTIEVRIPLEEA